MAITKTEFAEAYAARSGMTVAGLAERGRVPAPCSCSEPECEGWQMLSLDHDGIVAHIKALALREAADGLDRLAPPYVGLWLRNWADELDLEAGIPGPVVDLVAEWNALPQETRDANVARRTALLAEALDPTRRVED